MISERLAFAERLAIQAGELGLEYFRKLDTLTITQKGHQDLVSEADRNVETLIRKELANSYPDDSILGEEHGIEEGTSGYTWITDPIDGTANFVTGIPQWCVIIACVHQGQVIVGVIHDPVAKETFTAAAGQGAFLNGKQIKVSTSDSLSNGSVGVGFNGRTAVTDAVNVIGALVSKGGVFFRNASGGLMLAYTAAGRLIGYAESHMNAWDCLAGMLLIKEAGGVVMEQDVNNSLYHGARVVVGAPGVFGDIREIAESSFAPLEAAE
ncbi:inositol monophosphatase family protein [Roseibium album]|uniref:Inositol-1-monophosphatase n=1 Tax=Roseibium album TaxID=311410 RepID=A0A0M6ZG35_9HYPH|nr:inositol monophosphatase family protein [Roseibium album]MBG6155615.1 myo-inositol-1(or 4)-monophosphatase [Labrenzia sp. EL_162]MBG6194149.1 myo-inositol-1(or 4)-monophosphatase [Labrenzia sp. EL_159]CTQ61725.1 Inositol-1-monophosphatase [Roseibium album]CTQ75444.1 Inositol-1-monophosphatase [Roseibium album]CTQ78388.1 Inositol-1-monophosphatase [Roseibium album]